MIFIQLSIFYLSLSMNILSERFSQTHSIHVLTSQSVTKFHTHTNHHVKLWFCVLQSLHFYVECRKMNDSEPDRSKHSQTLIFVNVILFCYVPRCLNFITFLKDFLASLHYDFILCSGDEAWNLCSRLCVYFWSNLQTSIIRASVFFFIVTMFFPI
jgi:hypothetical protein